MNKIIFSLLFSLVTLTINAQDFKELPTISMETKEDFKENESVALECAQFILSHAPEYQQRNRLLAIQFILRWMEGTEITFELGEDFLKYAGKDTDRTAVYLAAMTTAALADTESATTDQINKQTSILFLDYCYKFSSLKRNKAIKKELKNYSRE
ncbi:hypothetical protein KFE94_12455 [bacterium SCSIO 12643]|nr:hypothetical protein KFE94_12455 [bacterium SCSIO 12643]